MSGLRQALEDLRQALLNAGDPSVDTWGTGLPHEAVEAMLQTTQLNLHPDAVTWFSWHDVPHDGSWHWIGGTHMSWIPLEFALEQYEFLRTMDSDIAPDLGGAGRYWPDDLFPIAAHGTGGGYLGVRAVSLAGDAAVAVFHPESGTMNLPASIGLADLVTSWALLHRTGGYRWLGDRWEEDRERVDAVLPPPL